MKSLVPCLDLTQQPWPLLPPNGKSLSLCLSLSFAMLISNRTSKLKRKRKKSTQGPNVVLFPGGHYFMKLSDVGLGMPVRADPQNQESHALTERVAKL